METKTTKFQVIESPDLHVADGYATYWLKLEAGEVVGLHVGIEGYDDLRMFNDSYGVAGSSFINDNREDLDFTFEVQDEEGNKLEGAYLDAEQLLALKESLAELVVAEKEKELEDSYSNDYDF